MHVVFFKKKKKKFKSDLICILVAIGNGHKNMFISSLYLLLVILVCLSIDGKSKPNFILYLADDLGYGEVNQHAPAFGFPRNSLSNDRKTK